MPPSTIEPREEPARTLTSAVLASSYLLVVLGTSPDRGMNKGPRLAV